MDAQFLPHVVGQGSSRSEDPDQHVKTFCRKKPLFHYEYLSEKKQKTN